MEFAFLDESGDLGKNSKYLVLTLVCTRKIKEITKIVRKTKQKLLEKNKCAKWLNQHGGEIKFYGFPDKNILKKLLNDLSETKMHVYFLCIKKGGVINQNIKYTILGELFQHSIENSDKIFPEKIIADLNFFNKHKKNYFVLQKYIKNNIIYKNKYGIEKKGKQLEISFSGISEKGYIKIKEKEGIMPLIIEQKNSRQSEPLQATDIISGAIFSKVEKNNEDYYKILLTGKNKISGTFIDIS